MTGDGAVLLIDIHRSYGLELRSSSSHAQSKVRRPATVYHSALFLALVIGLLTSRLCRPWAKFSQMRAGDRPVFSASTRSLYGAADLSLVLRNTD